MSRWWGPRLSLDERIQAEIERTGVKGWVQYNVGVGHWETRWDGCHGYIRSITERSAKRALLAELRRVPDPVLRSTTFAPNQR